MCHSMYSYLPSGDCAAYAYAQRLGTHISSTWVLLCFAWAALLSMACTRALRLESRGLDDTGVRRFLADRPRHGTPSEIILGLIAASLLADLLGLSVADFVH
ncbi:hypothetical protein FA95DRAFT_868181 [Auriscalpium vulgare]|uniref:Uncharacterized protein n=1 Tax=Auriscalpium vulgare TaxID=40419 RepID=A0ACB8R994_9AGAM|nr:hypothetical protein FA95DRAFT_868181 [Auriscalpium vulgare]